MTNQSDSRPVENSLASQEEVEKTTYLVTEDLSKLVKRWCEKKGEKCPDSHFFDEIMTSLCEAMQKHCFPDRKVTVVNLPQESFADILDRTRSKDAERLNEFWVALDDVYADIGVEGKDGFHISITRFVDEDDVDLKRGPRPESIFKTIEEQIEACAKSWSEASVSGKRPVVLVDDGMFTGRTVMKVLRLLADIEMKVDTIRLGVANPAAVERIAKWKHEKTGHSISFLGCLKLCPPVLDWVAERDFFPGVSLSGRAVGVMDKETPIPIRTNPCNRPFRKSYLSGWGQIRDWAKLKKGKDAFTLAALDLSLTLWEELEGKWGRNILVSDLEAVPWLFYRSNPAKMKSILDRRWLDVLKAQRGSVPS